jgi:hypothetical protein
MIRVGRTIYQKNGKRIDPSYNDFTNIVVLMKGHTEWGVIGPYDLVNDDGVIMENFWQFSKVYDMVPATKKTYSRYDQTVIWQHGKENHVKDGKLTQEYYDWRKKGMECKYAIRYPVGFTHRHKCKYALAYNDNGTINELNQLDYVESRKKIYVPEYCRLVKKEKKFKELQDRLKNGENLLVIEVDGPHQESLDYYKQKYNMDNDFIQDNTMIANEKNISIMLNDNKHAFGHGYCLTMALLDKDILWNK